MCIARRLDLDRRTAESYDLECFVQLSVDVESYFDPVCAVLSAGRLVKAQVEKNINDNVKIA